MMLGPLCDEQPHMLLGSLCFRPPMLVGSICDELPPARALVEKKQREGPEGTSATMLFASLCCEAPYSVGAPMVLDFLCDEKPAARALVKKKRVKVPKGRA